MDYARPSIKKVKDIFNIFNQYYQKIVTLSENGDRRITSILQNISEINEKFENEDANLEELTTSDETLETLFSTINSLNKLYNYIDVIKNKYDSMRLGDISITTYLSQTYILSTIDLYKRVVDRYNKFMISRKIEETSMIENLTRLIIRKYLNIKDTKKIEKTDQEIMDTYINLEQIFLHNPFSIFLYINILRTSIEFFHAEKGSDMKIVSFLLELIENDKNIILSQDFKIPGESEKNLIYILNPPLRTFGFIPVTPFMSIYDSLRTITINYFNNEEIYDGDISKVAKRYDICFIVIKRITSTPVYIDSTLLQDEKASRYYEQPKHNAISQKIIKRFSTINRSSPEEEYKWDFSFGVFDDVRTAMNFVIIETVDNSNFRILSTSKTEEFIIPRNDLEQFLQFLLTRNTKFMRSSSYNFITTYESLLHIFTKSRIDLEKEPIEKIYEAKHTRHSILIRLLELYHNVVREKYKNGKKLDEVAFGQIVHSERIQNIFTNSLIGQYNTHILQSKIYEVDDGVDKKFTNSEVFSSFLVTLHTLLREFKKELHTLYIKYRPSESLFEDTVDINIRLVELLKIFENIVGDALKNTVTDDSNIYQSILFKLQKITISV
jgi:hypothetical protein